MTFCSFLQNAEKLQRKAESRKTAATVAAEEAAKKKKVQKPRTKPAPLLVGSTASPRVIDVDSENMESASETESNSDDSGSDSTITDSGEETEISTVNSAPLPQASKGNPRSVKRANRTSTSSYRTEEAVGLFISAAEALDNMVPVDIALHDHSYALPPDALINNMDLQGSSGLSLIAAAAAVVSPSFPRSSGKSSPVLSPVRAPRGRPPNTQRKSGSNSASKLLPNFLSPAGSSSNVLLTDLKSPTFRSRTKSAPTDRPKSTMLHFPRAGSSLTKSSFSSSGSSVSGSSSNGSSSGGSRFGQSGGRGTSGGSGGSILPHTYSRQRSDTTSNKPVISLKTSQASTSAFEALVNVAVAAHPAELPRTSGSSPASSRYSPSTSASSHSHSRSSSSSSHSYPSNKGSSSSSSSKSGATLSTLINAHHHHHHHHHQHHPSSSSASSVSISSHKDSITMSATGGKTTAYIDVGQAISILASLAQQASSNSSTPTSISVQPFITGHPSTSFIGSLVSQVGSRQSGGGGSGGSSNKSAPSVETLIGHLTSGMANGAKSDSSKKSTSGSGGSSGTSKKTFSSKSEPSSNSVAATLSISQGPPANNSNSNSSNSSTSRDHKSLPSHSTSATTTPHTIQITANMDDLSNLNLLSSLVAAVAASQTANPNNTSSANSGASVHIQHQHPQPSPNTASVAYTLTNATTTGTPVTATRPNSLQAEHHRRASPVTVQRRSSMDVASSPSAGSSPAIPSRPHISSDLSSGGFPSSATRYSLENNATGSSSGRESEQSSSRDQDSYAVQIGNGNDSGTPHERESSDQPNLPSHQAMSYSSYSSEEDNLPRSVVRTSLAARVREGSSCESTNSSESPQDAYSANSPLNLPPSSSTKATSSSSLQSQAAAAPPSSSDMTASLASIIPPFNPSNSQQSSLLLYTHSLSFPLSAASEMATEEEDHLESATRGISELSKLLGTDSGGDAASSLNWNPADLLSPPQSSSKTLFSSKGAGGGGGGGGEYGNSTAGDEMAANTTKPVFSGLLESQIHGTIHHTPGLVNSAAVGKAAAAVSGSTATPAGVATSEELEHHSR